MENTGQINDWLSYGVGKTFWGLDLFSDDQQPAALYKRDDHNGRLSQLKRCEGKKSWTKKNVS